MKTLEELLLLWQEGSLSGEELVELKNHLGTREGRARLVDDILMTAVAIETLKADRVEGLSHSPLAGKGSAGGGRWSRRLARLAVAALILLALGLGAWIIFRAQEAQAAPSLIEQLVDWNLHLSEASSSDERQRIYQTFPGKTAPWPDCCWITAAGSLPISTRSVRRSVSVLWRTLSRTGSARSTSARTLPGSSGTRTFTTW
jgi:hypothetical protein